MNRLQLLVIGMWGMLYGVGLEVEGAEFKVYWGTSLMSKYPHP